MKEINLKRLASIPSTNSFAKENVGDLKLPALIIADEQTRGRGRNGKSFYSPRGTGLYATLVFEPDNRTGLLTCRAASAACEALEALGAKPKIKWVNDVLIDGRKVCGILAEKFFVGLRPYVCVGFGINLTVRAFPRDLANAGSVGTDCDKTRLALKISTSILEYAENPDADVVGEYRKRLILGKEITYVKNGLAIDGRAVDIDEACRLIIELPDGRREKISSGETTIKQRGPEDDEKS